MQRLKQLTLWADPPEVTDTLQAQEVALLVHSKNTDLPASRHLRVHPAALVAALRPFGQPTARVDPMNLILDFPASGTWRDAAQCGNPAAPYSVKRVGLNLTVIAAVVHAHLGSVAVYVEDGAVRVRLPLV